MALFVLIAQQATTTTCVSSTQMSDPYRDKCTAVATAMPVSHSQGSPWLSFKRRESPESLACQIHARATQALVQVLLVPRRPATVVRGVRAVVVGEPIKRVFWGWSRSHVGEKGGETGPPSFAHIDTTSTVQRVRSIRRCMAAVSSRTPCTMLRSHVRHVASVLQLGTIGNDAAELGAR